MRYFTGVSTKGVIEHLDRYPLAIMLQPDNHYERHRRTYGTWAVDNGCYALRHTLTGGPDDIAIKKTFEERWWKWVTRLADGTPGCAFVVAPDVVADAQATLAWSRPWLAKIRALGFPAALVAQNGLEDMDVPWDEFDVLFIGGTTEWKLSPMAALLVSEARQRGKEIHMGRVNSHRRITIAAQMGCDSVDGTYLRFSPTENLPKLLSWLEEAQSIQGANTPPVMVMAERKLRIRPPEDSRQGRLFRPNHIPLGA